MAGKIPVVVKRDRSVDGLIIHGETGYCFEKNEDAAALMAYALTHPDEAKAVAENGFTRISHLSAATFAKQVEQVYQSVL
jgi:glycosyltransferase involved in cell wall biosynthesis